MDKQVALILQCLLNECISLFKIRSNISILVVFDVNEHVLMHRFEVLDFLLPSHPVVGFLVHHSQDATNLFLSNKLLC